MKKSLAKLSFTPNEQGVMKLPPITVWYSVTQDCSPNDWSIRIIPVGNIELDNTVLAEIDFLMESADYLLKTGSKFKIFGLKFQCQAEILEEF